MMNLDVSRSGRSIPFFKIQAARDALQPVALGRLLPQSWVPSEECAFSLGSLCLGKLKRRGAGRMREFLGFQISM
jgi:hypothetical protein